MSEPLPRPRLPKNLKRLRRLLDRVQRDLKREERALKRQREIDPELWLLFFKGVA